MVVGTTSRTEHEGTARATIVSAAYEIVTYRPEPKPRLAELRKKMWDGGRW